MTGNLEVKKVLCTHGGGITVTSKWNTDNILNTTLDVEVCLILGNRKFWIPQNNVSGPRAEGIESEPWVNFCPWYWSEKRSAQSRNEDKSSYFDYWYGLHLFWVNYQSHCQFQNKDPFQDLNLGGPLVNTSAVVGHAGWLAGLQVTLTLVWKPTTQGARHLPEGYECIFS